VEVYPVGGNANDAIFRVPMHVATTGKLLLSQGGYANFADRATLTLSGTLEIQASARLRFEEDKLNRDLIVQNSAKLLGDGSLEINRGNRLFMAGNSAAVVKVSLSGGRSS